jgi:lysophospholipase L1-like esterase
MGKSKGRREKVVRVTLITVFSIVAVLAVALSVTAAIEYKNGNLGFSHPMVEPEEGDVRVACVGDSITYGANVKGWPENSYPMVLDSLLGDGYCVNNFGYSGRTAMADGDYPYADEKLYQESLDYLPDIVVIMFGTNDSKSWNWKGEDAFIADYSELIENYASLSSNPEIYVIAPPPAFPVDGATAYSIDGDIIKTYVCDACGKIASAQGYHLIDMYSVFEDRVDLFYDGVHPTAEGARLFAETVHQAIVG